LSAGGEKQGTAKQSAKAQFNNTAICFLCVERFLDSPLGFNYGLCGWFFDVVLVCFEGNARGYFQERERLEERIILENDWLSFWQNCSWLDEPLENLTFQIPTY
jgi:hypothetical protein